MVAGREEHVGGGGAAAAVPVDSQHLGDLQIVPVTSHGWRVTDRRLPAGDPYRFLALIERRGDVYEVIQLGVGIEWHEFDSLQAATEHVAATGSRLADARRADPAGPPPPSTAPARARAR